MKKLLLLLLCLVGLKVSSAQAQLTVTQTSFENGAVNIGMNDTLWVTFSKKIAFNEGLNGEMARPKIRYAFTPASQQRPLPVLVSEDSMKLGFQMQLVRNGPQQFVLWRAQAKDGAQFDQPLLIHFSTDERLADGEFTGTVAVQDDGQNAKGTWVYLVSSQMITEQSIKSGAMAASRLIWVENENGTFTIPYVNQGAYMAFAFKHADLDKNFFMPGIMYGFADADQNSIPDLVTVPRRLGQNVEIPISSLEFVYTSTDEHKDEVIAKAKEWNQSAMVASIKSVGPVSIDGKSPVWEYIFSSDRPGQYLLMNYTGANYWMVPLNVGETKLPGITNYVSSTTALIAAETEAGTQLRADNDSVRVSMSLLPGFIFNPQLTKHIWAVNYLAFKDLQVSSKLVLIGAETGEVVKFGMFSAKEAGALVKKDVDLNFTTKPVLVGVNGFNVQKNGKSPLWSFDFIDIENRERYLYTVIGDGRIQKKQVRDSVAFRPVPIDSNWVDSNVIIENSEYLKEFMDSRYPTVHIQLSNKVNYALADTNLIWTLRVLDKEENQRSAMSEEFDAHTGELFRLPLFTAFDGNMESGQTAKEWDVDAVLFKINSLPQLGVNPEGEAFAWQHWYQSTNKPNRLLIVTVSGDNGNAREVIFDSTRTAPVFPALLPLNGLLNSSQIMAMAENNGGSEKRGNDKFYAINMNLDNIYVQPDSSVPVWMVHYPYMNDRENNVRHAVIQINAVTGELFERPVRTTERNPVRIAMEAAREWSKDAKIRFAKADSLDENGLVDFWKFGFFSREKQLGLVIEVQSGTTIINQYEVSLEDIAELRGADLPDWTESSDAFAKAEAVVGKKYRDSGKIKNVKANLFNEEVVSKSTFISNTELATWEITYELTDGTNEVVFVQGETITTAVDSFDNELPNVVTLSQNYPNPFNPSTTIGFSIPQYSKVQLTVYSILGQEVAVLVDQAMSAGNHAINFNASKLASGTYLYQLRVNNKPVQVRKLTLIK
jgi:hypothetical protein